MEKPIYVIRPQTTWDVIEVRNGKETVVRQMCQTEESALDELRDHLKEEDEG